MSSEASPISRRRFLGQSLFICGAAGMFGGISYARENEGRNPTLRAMASWPGAGDRSHRITKS